MVFPFRISPFLIYLFIVGNLLTGCVSYRFIKATEGRSVSDALEEFQAGKTTLQEALEALGAFSYQRHGQLLMIGSRLGILTMSFRTGQLVIILLPMRLER